MVKLKLILKQPPVNLLPAANQIQICFFQLNFHFFQTRYRELIGLMKSPVWERETEQAGGMSRKSRDLPRQYIQYCKRPKVLINKGKK